jgi:hypothetical protein
MTVRLSIDDFKLLNAVCELRYEDAYLIYDRTGVICREAKEFYTNGSVSGAAPAQTIFQADEGSFVLEMSQCRFSTTKPDPSLEKFAMHCKKFFNSAATHLEIRVFTRVGFRVVFRKDFSELEEAKAALVSLKIVNLPSEERFGASAEPHEMLLRWEGSQIGAVLRLKAESGKIDVVLPPELEAEKSEFHKSINGLTLDVDYYTAAPVERSQLDAEVWIPRSLRTIRKNVDAIFGN